MLKCHGYFIACSCDTAFLSSNSFFNKDKSKYLPRASDLWYSFHLPIWIVSGLEVFIIYSYYNQKKSNEVLWELLSFFV